MKFHLYDCTNILGISSLTFAACTTDEIQTLAGLLASLMLAVTSAFSIVQKICEFFKNRKK